MAADLLTSALQHEAGIKPISIVRTERGLTAQGTCITLYDIIDNLINGHGLHEICNLLPLTKLQLEVAMEYISSHYIEVIGEYHQVLQESEEIRQYWETYNLDRLAEVARKKFQYGKTSLKEIVKAWKQQEAQG